MIMGIAPGVASFTPVGFVFTFQQAIFASALAALAPSPSSAAGIAGFATAWESAMLASTVVVGPGSFVPPPLPTSIFSAVFSTTIDASSIASGKNKIMELVSSAPVDDAQNSDFPVKFREATLLLTFTAIGLDSEPIPPAGPGPQPFSAVNVPLE